MEELIILAILVFVVGIPLTALVLALVALARSSGLRDRVAKLDIRVDELRRRPGGETKAAPPERPAEESHAEPVVVAPEPEPPEEPAEPTVPREERRAAAVAKLTTGEVRESAAGAPAEEKASRKASFDWWETFEQSIGKRWMSWVGVMILFGGVAFFVKHAFEQGWLDETTRIVLGCLLGIALLVGGHVSIRRRMRGLGQGLLGGGLATLYVSLFAGYSMYGLMSAPVAFGLMAGVTVVGVAIAMLHDALAISFIAVLGGLLTPVMVSTGRDARDVLFSYLMLLDLGVLVIAYFKQWRPLELLSFVGTAVLFAAWHFDFYSEAALVPAMLWLCGFYVLFLVLPFVYNIRRKESATVGQLVLALANATFVFGFAWTMMEEQHPHSLGLISAVMTVCYSSAAVFWRKRIPFDAPALLGFAALSMMALTITVPLHLGLNGITLAWAAEAPVLLYIGCRYRYLPVRIGGLIVLLLSIGRVFGVHLPLHTGAEHRLFLNVEYATAVWVPLMAWVFAVVLHIRREDVQTGERYVKVAVAIGAGLLALVLTNIELVEWFDDISGMSVSQRHYEMLSSVVALWAVGAAGFVASGLWGSRASVAATVLCIGFTFLCGFDLYSLDMRGDITLFINVRFASLLAAVAVAFCLSWSLRSFLRYPEGYGRAASIFYSASGFALLVLLSGEVSSIAGALDSTYAARCALTLLWVVGSGVFTAVGLRAAGKAYMAMGLILLWFGVLFAVGMYSLEVSDHLMVANARFVCGGVVALAFLATAFVIQSYDYELSSVGRVVLKLLWGSGAALLLLLLSAEPWTYWHSTVDDGKHAEWLAQMSLSIVWSLYAVAALTIGFIYRKRNLRFCALGLFGLTALKVILFDMTGVEDVYRIISFFGLGGLMIAGSFLYHYAEKRLTADAQ